MKFHFLTLLVLYCEVVSLGLVLGLTVRLQEEQVLGTGHSNDFLQISAFESTLEFQITGLGRDGEGTGFMVIREFGGVTDVWELGLVVIQSPIDL